MPRVTTPGKQRPLWQCPKCGRRFVTANLWHSCVVYTVEDHLSRVPKGIGELYRGFEAMVRSIGPIEVAPVKTRIAFMTRMRFAGARVQRRALEVAFLLTRRVESARFARVEQFGPRSFGYYVKIRRAEELDDELREWLVEAYDVGLQKPRD